MKRTEKQTTVEGFEPSTVLLFLDFFVCWIFYKEYKNIISGIVTSATTVVAMLIALA